MSTTNINLLITQPDPLDIAKITPFFPTETQGEPGEDPTFRIASQVLQWKYVSQGNDSYTNLIDFTNLQLPIANITDLQSGLNAKAPQSNTDTKAEVDSKIAAAVANLINSAPGALDTLDELAAAMGDDPNFAATIVNSLAGKVSLAGSYANPSWITSLAASKLTGLSFAQVSDAIGVNLLELQNSMKSAGYIQSGLNGVASSNAGFIFTDKVNTTSAFTWSSTNGIASLFAGATYKTPVKFNESGAVTLPEYNTGFAKFNDDGDISSVSLAIADVASLQAALDSKAVQATTYTKTETDSNISAAVANLINSAPGALDTLNELANALGGDANFATTVTNSLAGKVSLSGSYSNPSWITALNVAQGGTGAASFTAGRILFGNGTSALGSSSNLNWDNSNREFKVYGTINNQGAGTSNTVYNGVLTYGSGLNFISSNGYWAIRTGTGYDFNIDVYNANSPFSALKINQSGVVSIGATTASTSTTTGSLITAGGFGAAGNINGGGYIKTAQSSANGAGSWKLGKQIGADGTGATSFIEVEIEGVLYILTAKIK